MKWEGFGNTQPSLIVGYCLSTFLEELRKTTKILIKNCWYLDFGVVPRQKSHNHSTVTYGKNCSRGVSTITFCRISWSCTVLLPAISLLIRRNCYCRHQSFEVHIPGNFILLNLDILGTKTRSHTDSRTEITSICTVSFTLQRRLSITFNTPT